MTLTTATAAMDIRYSFMPQFLRSGATFVQRCRDIESSNPSDADEPTRTEHRGLVTATIIQCVAAVEAESAEVALHGPGSHLGSNAPTAARDILLPFAEFIDDQRVLQRYNLILHLLRKPPLNKGEPPWQNMDLLVRLRNELVHYKSKWGREMEGQKLFTSLQDLRLPKPPFVSQHASFFPHQFLSAECAAWSVRTTVAFLNAFYDRLEIECPLKPYAVLFQDV